MGRRHLGAIALLAAALSLPAAGAGVGWQFLAGGPMPGGALETPQAYLAAGRAAAAQLGARVPADGRAALRGVDFSRDAVLAVFGEWGCQDHRIAVTSISRHGGTIVVSLARRPLAPGTVECQALYPTYRLLKVTKARLGQPLPTRARAQFARS